MGISTRSKITLAAMACAALVGGCVVYDDGYGYNRGHHGYGSGRGYYDRDHDGRRDWQPDRDRYGERDGDWRRDGRRD